MRSLAPIKVLCTSRTLVLIGTAGMLMLAWAATGGTVWAQTPRPTLTPPAPTAPPAPTDTPSPVLTPAVQAPSGYSGPILRGKVLNLSTGQPESGVTVVFSAGGVSVEAISDDGGQYAFPHLGAANGMLNVVPSRESGLRPATGDVAVRSRPGVETVVNLGVSLNGGAAPPLLPTVQLAPDSVGAGNLMTITVIVKNTLSNRISGATVTDWLPERLVPVNIKSSTGNPYFSGNLAVVELGSLNPGDGALIEIVAQANGGRTATSALQGKVSLFYRENAAAQSQVLGQSNGAAPTVLPVTGVGLPVIGLGLIAIVIFAGWMRRRVSRFLPVE